MTFFKQLTEAEKVKEYNCVYLRLLAVDKKIISAALAEYIIEHSAFNIEDILKSLESIK